MDMSETCYKERHSNSVQVPELVIGARTENLIGNGRIPDGHLGMNMVWQLNFSPAYL